MRYATIILVVIVITALPAHAGSEHLVKQRAKDLSKQNDARQGVTPAAPAQPASPMVTPSQPAYRVAPKPAQPALSPQAAALRDTLVVLQKSDKVTEEQRQQLAADLKAAAQKPSDVPESAVTKLAKDLSDAVNGKKLSPTQQSHIAKHVQTALNGGTLSAKQMEALVADVEKTLRSGGASRIDASVVANDLRFIIAELQRETSK